MRRRRFLASSVLGLPLVFDRVPFALGRHLWRAATGAEASGRVLVLIQLQGGNDGLNALVPLDSYDVLAELRGGLLVPTADLVPLTDSLALHPALAALKGGWDDGRLRIVQGVAYPDQNRSHFRSSDIWHTGSGSREQLRTGWLGRHFAHAHPDYPADYPSAGYPDPFAVSLGVSLSQTCEGEAASFGFGVSDPFDAVAIDDQSDPGRAGTLRSRELDFVRTAIAQANRYGAVVRERVLAGRTVAAYPDSALGAQLRYVAQMISGGLETSVYTVSLGGFDTHANQVEAGSPATGVHADLLRELAEAVAAFQTDLGSLGLRERVVGMTYSEFGRRIRANGSRGTDHGTAAPMLLFGDAVEAGVLGSNPTIDRAVDVSEGVAMQYDFRDVYGSILEDWFAVEPEVIRGMLRSEYSRLPIIRRPGGEPSATRSPASPAELRIVPTAFSTRAAVEFTLRAAGRSRLESYDVYGRQLEVLFDRTLPAGRVTFHIDASSYPCGPIVLRLRQGAHVAIARGVRS